MSDKSYSKQQLNRIIERALQLQQNVDQSRSDSVEPRHGHSLQDLIAVGRELGIGEEQIRLAASEIESPDTATTVKQLLGDELTYTRRYSLPYQISRDQAEEVAIDLERIIGLPGQVSTAGARVSWQSNYLAAQQRGWTLGVSVAPRGNETVVEIESRNGMLAGGLFGGGIGGVGLGAGLGVGLGVGLGSLSSPLFAVFVPIAFLGGSYLLSRTIYRGVSRSRRRRVDSIAERIRDILDNTEGASVPEMPGPDHGTSSADPQKPADGSQGNPDTSFGPNRGQSDS